MKLFFLYCLSAWLEDIADRQEKDEETGLYYYGQRYLDPRYNIWTTSDPAIYEYFDNVMKGEGGVYDYKNLNTYHYAGNNPIVYTDPDGEVKWKQFFVGIGKMAGGVLSYIGAAASSVTVGGMVALGSLGTYLLTDGFAMFTTALADQQFDGALHIMAEEIATLSGASTEAAALVGDGVDLALDVVSLSVKVPTAGLKAVLGTSEAVKIYDYTNIVVNSLSTVNDSLTMINDSLTLFMSSNLQSQPQSQTQSHNIRNSNYSDFYSSKNVPFYKTLDFRLFYNEYKNEIKVPFKIGYSE